MRTRVLSVLSVVGYLSAVTQAAEPMPSLDAPAVQAETASASQRLLERANRPVMTSDINSNKSMTALPKDEIAFPIHQIDVGSKDSHFKYLRHALSSYEGQNIGQKGIEQLSKLVQERLLSDGYITSRVIVPNQDLTKGKLTLEVIPGYIEDIEMKNPSMRGNWRAAFPLRPHDVLQRDALEQGVDQMRAVVGQDIKVTIEPGEKENTSRIILDPIQKGYIHGGFTIDDAGYEATGKVQGTTYLSISQLLVLQDTLQASYTKDLERHDSRYGSDQYSISYRIPQGNTSYRVAAYKYKYHQTVAAITPFLSEGTTKGMEFGAERLINRTSRTKTTGIAKIIHKERHNFLNGEELGVQEQHTTALEIGLSHRKYKGNTAFDIYSFYRQGVPWLGAKEQEWEGIGDNPTSRYHLWGLEGQIQSRIRIGHKQGMHTLRFRSQFTDNHLLGTDQFSIGGRYTVRGFSGEQTLRGESGYYVQNEWSIPFSKGHIAPYIGVDVGHVWGPSTDWQVGTTLMGTVLGVRGSIGNGLSYDVFVGKPLQKPEGFKADANVWGFSLGYHW